jgi:ABC-type branched-subunit amino acid transport system substrate-binding protein
MRTPHVGALLLMLGWAAATANASELTAEETRGKQIYTSGTSPSGEAITAHMGVDGFPLPASVMPCASCHGPDGRGRPEGGVIPSDITWGHLTQSYGHQHSYGREHPAYTEETAARAIGTGFDPAGNRLEIAMPLYRMAPDDLDALVAYLKEIETDYDPGITQDSIRLATMLPLSGRLAPLGEAMRAVLQAYVDELNSAGGVNGRLIELVVIPFGTGPEEAIGNLRQTLGSKAIFALLAPYGIGIEEALAELAEDEMIPVIGPYTLQPPLSAALDRYTFYTFSGPEHQLSVLVDLAAERFEGRAPQILLAGADVESVHKLVDAVSRQCQVDELQAPTTFYYAPGELNAEQLARKVQTAESELLFFFGTPAELGGVLENLAAADAGPMVFLPADLVTRSLFDAPLIFDGRIMSAYPRSPSDISESGRRVYAELRDKYELSSDHASAQLAVLAATVTLAEGLKRAGKNLSRESLVMSLQSLHRYETGFAPPITYTLNRRIGALGAHAVKLDLAHKSFVPVDTWRSLK